MFSAVCPNCSSNILLREPPTDGRVTCKGCGKSLRFGQAPKQIPFQGAPRDPIEAEFEVNDTHLVFEEENLPSVYSDWETEHKSRKTLILLSLAIPVCLVAGVVLVAFARSGKTPTKSPPVRLPESVGVDRPVQQRMPIAKAPVQEQTEQNTPKLRLPRMAQDGGIAGNNNPRRGSRSRGGEEPPPIIFDLEEQPEVRPETRPSGRSAARPPANQPSEVTPPTASKSAESHAILRSLITELTDRKNSIEKRIKTASTIAELGPEAKDASTALCATMLNKNLNLARAATEALEKVNPQIHSLAVVMLVDRNAYLRQQAIASCAGLGSEAYPLTQIVLQVRLLELTNSHNDITEAIIPVLASIAANDKAVAKTVANWLVSDQHNGTRAAAANAIPKFEAGKDYLPLLIQVVKTDPAPIVQLAAINSIGRFGEDAKNAEEVLRLCKTHSDGVIRQAASRTLELIGVVK
jgi:hypothetical protein